MAEEMSFWDHLEELRWCFFRVLIALFIVLVGVFIALPYIFDDFILGAAKGDFFMYRLFGNMLGPSGDVDIININVATPFLTHITTSFWLSLVLVFPYLIYQIWVFIKPALFPNEAKGAKIAFTAGTGLFYVGCAVGYLLVFPLTFKFLTQYTIGESIANQISLNSYMSNFLTVVFVMGLVFEIPMLAWVLSSIGILKKSFLKKYRRHAIVILVVLAAVITPSGDPFTLSVVFLPLYMLYEISILIVRPDDPEDEEEAKDTEAAD